MIYGLDLLGAPKYATAAYACLQPGLAFGVFWDTFGPAAPLVKKIAAASKVRRVIRVAVWRNHVFPQTKWGELVEIAKQVEALARRYPQHEWYFSPAHEHRLAAKDAAELLRRCAAAAPHVIMVNSAEGNKVVLKGQVNEVHGAAAKAVSGAYLASFDGNSCTEADVESWKATHAGALVQFFWKSEFNGKRRDDETTPIPKRDGWPNLPLLQSIIVLARPRGEIDKLPGLTLWKSHAENVKGGARSNRPCYISPKKVPSFTVRTLDQKEVITMTRSTLGPVTSPPWSRDKPGYRYYSSIYGYEIANKAEKISGEVCVTVDGARIDPCFRQGFYKT